MKVIKEDINGLIEDKLYFRLKAIADEYGLNLKPYISSRGSIYTNGYSVRLGDINFIIYSQNEELKVEVSIEISSIFDSKIAFDDFTDDIIRAKEFYDAISSI